MFYFLYICLPVSLTKEEVWLYPNYFVTFCSCPKFFLPSPILSLFLKPVYAHLTTAEALSGKFCWDQSNQPLCVFFFSHPCHHITGCYVNDEASGAPFYDPFTVWPLRSSYFTQK